jgi:hypothetical protein
MASFLDQIFSKVLTAAIGEATTYEPAILAWLKTEGISLTSAVDLWINGLKIGGTVGGALTLVLDAIKPQLIAEINNAIATGAVTEEQALYTLVVNAATAEAKVLAAG